MSFSPQISVIVPVFNAGAQLVPSIESLLKQSLADIEIIIVNDASTDSSASVIDKLAEDNANILPVHLSVNKGVHEARLAGLAKSSAPWIGFLDADDFAKPGMFETLLSSAVDYDVDIVVCGSNRVTSQRKIIAPKVRFRRSEKVLVNTFDRFCAYEFGSGMLWNKLFKRSIIEPWFDLHFPWRQSINEDLLMNIGCFYQAKSVYLCKEVLHDYVLHESSATANIPISKAYVNTYRAAALAISNFSGLGDDTLSKIIDMYRIQLSWRCYQVDNAALILSYEKELREATDVINDVFPAALALLAARPRPPVVNVELALKSLFHRCLTAVGLR
ncbi:glycosyltransferase [Marinobacter salinexigens]|uniref:Glycosyltransferase n=1 Tax=Marinobacter salinexigens TaxID=2919747 RepID=A0A5B0VIU8_9GAMM|nr:glycosyltransferase [Marinobacter salinexigens]KAA1174660.1 glycosyltransferase [Marinobacter salinexigens]